MEAGGQRQTARSTTHLPPTQDSTTKRIRANVGKEQSQQDYDDTSEPSRNKAQRQRNQPQADGHHGEHLETRIEYEGDYLQEWTHTVQGQPLESYQRTRHNGPACMAGPSGIDMR